VKLIASIVVITCTGVGYCVGGALNAYGSFQYRNALESESFLYLVDQSGNPVRQDPKRALGS
jgi:hypothetical protein